MLWMQLNIEIIHFYAYILRNIQQQFIITLTMSYTCTVAYIFNVSLETV